LKSWLDGMHVGGMRMAGIDRYISIVR